MRLRPSRRVAWPILTETHETLCAPDGATRRETERTLRQRSRKPERVQASLRHREREEGAVLAVESVAVRGARRVVDQRGRSAGLGPSRRREVRALEHENDV